MARRFTDMLPFIIAALALYLLWHYIDRIFLLLFQLSEPLSKYL